MSPIPWKAILFDLDNTLIDRDGAFRRWLADFQERHARAFPPERRAEDLAAIERADDHGYLERADFCAWLAAAYPAIGLSAEEVSRDYHARFPDFVEPAPLAARELSRIRGRYVLALVTNGESYNQREKLLRVGLAPFFPHVLVSAEVGARKPDRRIFERALEAAGAAPADALMVGDDPRRDIAGGAGAGVATCWISHGRAFPDGLPRPDFAIRDITELSRVVPQ